MKTHPNEVIVLHGWDNGGLSIRALPDGKYAFVVRDGKEAEAVYGPLIAADLTNAGTRLRDGIMGLPVYAAPRKKIDWYDDAQSLAKGLLDGTHGRVMAGLVIDSFRWSTTPQGSNYWQEVYIRLKSGAFLAGKHKDEMINFVLDKIGETP